MIGGCDSNSQPSLMSGCTQNSVFSIQKAPMALYHPADTKLNDCNSIFAKNYKLFHSVFVENTIKEISAISKL